MSYLSIISCRLGSTRGIEWFTGYLLEFIFSIENVFVFHIVVKAFRTPQRLTQTAIFRLSHWVLGRRLMLTYEENGSVFVYKDRRLCVSLLFPLICCLLAVDFFLEVDVTLT